MTATRRRATFTLPIDVVVADSLLPDLGDARERIEASGRPVSFVFVSAAGARWLPGKLPLRDGDQVVPKPPSSDSLRAAVAAALQGADTGEPETPLDGAIFDRAGQRVLYKGTSVQLTPIEFNVLDRLVRSRGVIVSTEDLLENVWGYAPGTGSSEVVRSHLKNLRAKLRGIGTGHDLIETVPRRGYRFVAG